MLSVLIGSIPFIILLVFLTIWIYAFVYNHNIIQTSGRLHILPSQINEYIQAHLIHKYSLRIIDVKVSEDDFDEGKWNTTRSPMKHLERMISSALYSVSPSPWELCLLCLWCVNWQIFTMSKSELFCSNLLLTPWYLSLHFSSHVW